MTGRPNSQANDTICSLYMPIHSGVGELLLPQDARTEQVEANARLIAAAPDLLNACREALEIRSLAYQVDANPKLDILTRREIERKVDGIIERIEAAIAKAEGRDR